MKKLTRKIFDPTLLALTSVSHLIVSVLKSTNITSVQVTILNFVLFVPPMIILIIRGTHIDLLIVLVLLVLYSLFDLVDGELARETHTQSPLGAWLDPSLDTILHLMVTFAIVLHMVLFVPDPMKTLAFIPLFAQVVAHILGHQLTYKFKLDSFSGNKLLNDMFAGQKKVSFLDTFLKNMLVPTNQVYIALFTLRFYFLLGALFNILPFMFILFGIFISIRAVTIFFILALHYSKRELSKKYLTFKYLEK